MATFPWITSLRARAAAWRPLALGAAALVLGALVTPSAQAHPFSSDLYSLRSSVKVSAQGQLATLVVLEAPIPAVMAGLGVEDGDSRVQKKRKVDAWNQQVWDQMAAGLTLEIDGQPAKGAWMPIEHELNGKAAEGFFVYMVGFKLEQELPATGFTVRIDNRAFADKPMVYSGAGYAIEPWVVVQDSSDTVLGELADAPLENPGRWTQDEAMRELVVRVEKH